MKHVWEDFDGRVEDIERYYLLLKNLDTPGALLTQKQGRKRQCEIDRNAIKVVRASFFLLLYNLVESTIRSALGEIYRKIKVEGVTINNVIDDLRLMWIDQYYRKLDSYSASPRTYQETAMKLIGDIMDDVIVEMSSGALPISGNLDADTIRKICTKHQISIKSHYRAYGGAELSVVKKKRNALAHGNESFLECGREYTVADLQRIMKQVVVYMRSILRNMTSYYDNDSYRK